MTGLGARALSSKGFCSLFTALMVIVWHGYEEVPEKLARLAVIGIDVNATDGAGETALVLALFQNRAEVVASLLGLGRTARKNRPPVG